ncbi:MAG: transposase [Erythrobacteraceae bacterium]|nr:transposase [Erythrobacteraceae bacterium]
MVAECWPGGERVSDVARRHALDPSQIYGWRKELVRQCKAHGSAVPVALEPQAPAFVPAVVAPDDTQKPAPDLSDHVAVVAPGPPLSSWRLAAR